MLVWTVECSLTHYADTLTAAYAAEICPIQLRGYSTSFISMCWGMGSFIASGGELLLMAYS
jgi:hypothetical protein